MSRPHMPRISWPACRLAVVLLLAVMLPATCLTRPAAAEPRPPVAPMQTLFALRHLPGLDAALRHQVLAQAAAAPKAPTKKPAAAPPRKPVQRASRPAARPALAPTVAGARTLARVRLTATQYGCLDNVVRRESGWNHRATNPSSGAYGLFQALPASKMASAGKDWRTNPLTQMKWGLSYIKSRYGTPCGAWNFWQKNHWY
ncbi:aggregation-promoting factor C-terminal-like domain-containing protein [Actinacidiphila glaucinigra]|uniref:aggregation-promoting factor C-terminal-like domain-containing protein n=1 Tax=Actinacidiphila glaucinigra TaxID=235986 RepID=UPI00366A5888